MITVFCSDQNHPAYYHLSHGCNKRRWNLVSTSKSLIGGDFLFLVSCTEIINKEVRDRYTHVLVIHESDVPQGRGWSPLAWQVQSGRNEIVVSMLAAEDEVDSGAVWAKKTLVLEGHELADEIAEKAVNVKFDLMDLALCLPTPRVQEGLITKYHRRTPADSRLDVDKTIAAQFNLLRICEPRFPAFFDYMGHRYRVTITKA